MGVEQVMLLQLVLSDEGKQFKPFDEVVVVTFDSCCDEQSDGVVSLNLC